MTRAWLLASLVLAAAAGGCAEPGTSGGSETITARPGAGGGACAPGTHPLAVGSGRRALMRVTAGSIRGRKALVLALHGAGGGAKDGLWVFRGGWDAAGVVMVSPAAGGRTWSALYGPDADLATVNRALRQAFRRCRIDPERVGVGGFSDGATYALTLGLANGRLFRAIMALSPGGIVGRHRAGRPRIFVAHGRSDTILPFDRTRGELVPDLRRNGYAVTFRPFAGGHEVREAESRAAVRWFLRG